MKYQGYDTYEYMLFDCGGLSPKSIIQKMNEYGKEGWEVITTFGQNKYPSIDIASFLLKRRILTVEI